MFFAMQIMVYLSIYDVPFPANVVVYVKQFESLIKFDLLNPVAIAKLFDPDFDFKVYVLGMKDLVKTDPDQSASIVGDIFFFLMAGTVLIIIVILMLIAKLLLPMLRDKINTKIQAFKKKFLWNGVIRSTNISFIQVCITCGVQLKLLVKGSKY